MSGSPAPGSGGEHVGRGAAEGRGRPLARPPIRRGALWQAVARARQRGDIPSTVDLQLAVDLLSSPAFYRRFIAHRAFPRRCAAGVVDHVLRSLLLPPGGGGARARRRRERPRSGLAAQASAPKP